MTTPGVGNDQMLSANLIPSISDSSSSLVVVRITGLRLARQSGSDAEVETGRVSLNVVAVIRSFSLAVGGNLEVPVRRMAEPPLRVRNRINQWNALPLKEGDFLLAAVKPAGSPGVWQAVAARQIQSAADPLVGALRECNAIETFDGPASQKREMLSGALASGQDLKMFYALDALGRRSVLGRDAGAELIARAIVAARIAPAQKLELGGYLARLSFFRPDAKVDRTNQMVMVALAHGLVGETDPATRASWAGELVSVLGNEFSPRRDENTSVRMALIRSVSTPSAAQVIQALEAAEQQVPREERPRIRELMHSWRDASAATQ